MVYELCLMCNMCWTGDYESRDRRPGGGHAGAWDKAVAHRRYRGDKRVHTQHSASVPVSVHIQEETGAEEVRPEQQGRGGVEVVAGGACHPGRAADINPGKRGREAMHPFVTWLI